MVGLSDPDRSGTNLGMSERMHALDNPLSDKCDTSRISPVGELLAQRPDYMLELS